MEAILRDVAEQRGRARFTEEFKRRVIEEYLEEGKLPSSDRRTARAIARENGISPAAMYGWLEQRGHRKWSDDAEHTTIDELAQMLAEHEERHGERFETLAELLTRQSDLLRDMLEAMGRDAERPAPRRRPTLPPQD